jgi:preprotein translocase subunit SecD
MTGTQRTQLIGHFLFWAMITIPSVYFVYNLKHYINFGIDLVGGTYVTLQVQLDKAHENELVEELQTVNAILKKKELPRPARHAIDDTKLTLEFDSVQSVTTVEQALIDRLKNLQITSDEKNIILRLPENRVETIDREAIRGNINALNSRVNQFGVGEVLIASQGYDRIIVELPNVHNPQQAKSVIGKTALLEIKPVEDTANSEKGLLDKYDGDLPEGTIIAEDKKGKEAFLVPEYTDLTGRLLKNAQVSVGTAQNPAEPVVAFEFKEEGAEKFEELTSEYIGERIAIIIDNEVIVAPAVQSTLREGGVITGRFTDDEARNLATLLRAGAFVAPVTFAEERQIGSSLGQEAIQSGLMACAVGLALLLIFSLVVYKMSGLFAFIVLLYNLVLTLVLLASLHATLTLPGIAGMILTVGMAIDASILIYERIREELEVGAPFRKAVNMGFNGAMAVILDANVTHVIISVVLYTLGSGPIQGFAITMIVGIISTLITGLLLLRYIFNMVLSTFNVNKLSI